jgi:hypothetical protein
VHCGICPDEVEAIKEWRADKEDVFFALLARAVLPADQATPSGMLCYAMLCYAMLCYAMLLTMGGRVQATPSGMLRVKTISELRDHKA